MGRTRLVITLAALHLLFACPRARAASQTVAAGDSIELSSDLVLSGTDALEVAGTADKPCRINGNGHQIKSGDKWVGRLKVSHCRIEAVGAAGNKPELFSFDLIAGGEASINIESCTFDASSGVNIINNGNSSTRFCDNTLQENILTTVSKDLGESRNCFTARGSSSAAKTFQGNRIYRAHTEFDSPHWLIGGSTDAQSNILIGQRVKITAGGEGTVVRGNYIHLLMPRNDEFPYYSQVSTFTTNHGAVGEHNIIRDGEWITQFCEGEFRCNVVCDINDHNLMRSGSYGRIHHNLFITGKPDHPPGSMFSCISIVYEAKPADGGMEIFNNTFDGCGTMAVPALDVCPGGFVRSLRNNVFMNFALPEKYIKTPAAMICRKWDEDGGTSADRLGYADYNCFFNPLNKARQNYILTVKDKNERKDDGFARHDLPAGGDANAQVDPMLTGPLPTEFPFNDKDIKTGKVTISTMLSHFRKVYAPAAGSPLSGSGDPADGKGAYIGAISPGEDAPDDQFGRLN